MRNFHIVCDFDEDLIRRFQNKALVVKTRDLNLVQHIHWVISEHNKNHCIEVDYRGALSAMPVEEEWKDIPMHIFVERFGVFRDLVPKLPVLRGLSARFFLNTDEKDFLTNTQILASLGVNTGIKFGKRPVNWEALNDLMHYDVYAKVPHASIQPFHYLVTEYQADQQTDFNTVYFDNPKKYVHVNAEGKVALSSNDLKDGNFILDNVDQLDQLENMKAYKDYLHRWQEFFFTPEGCSSCPAWRVCLGAFADQVGENPGCTRFFSDLMNAADFVNEKNQEHQVTDLCQP